MEKVTEMYLCHIYLAIACFVLVQIYKRYWGNRRHKPRRLNYPPGPWNLPVVGYMPFLVINPYQQLERLGRTYGSIFTIFLGKYR